MDRDMDDDNLVVGSLFSTLCGESQSTSCCPVHTERSLRRKVNVPRVTRAPSWNSGARLHVGNSRCTCARCVALLPWILHAWLRCQLTSRAAGLLQGRPVQRLRADVRSAHTLEASDMCGRMSALGYRRSDRTVAASTPGGGPAAGEGEGEVEQAAGQGAETRHRVGQRPRRW